MTTLAYRDGVLASDSLCAINGMKSGNFKKVLKTKNGYLVGVCGELVKASEFLEWADDGFNPEYPNIEGAAALVITPDREVLIFEDNKIPAQVDVEFIAEGSGREIAMGAMAMGATAEQAVEIAIKYHCGSGGPVQVVKLD